MGKKIDWVKAGLLKGYKFDGCTSSPDFNFVSCCNKHDYDYQDLTISRARADKRLRKCMQRKGWIFLPWFYWAMVRVFGGNHYKRKQDEKAKTVDLAVSRNIIDASSL